MRIVQRPKGSVCATSLLGAWSHQTLTFGIARQTAIAVVVFLCCTVAAAISQTSDTPKLDVAVLDQSHLPVPAAQVEIKLRGHIVATVSADETGHAVFPALNPGRYAISALKEGFETAVVDEQYVCSSSSTT